MTRINWNDMGRLTVNDLIFHTKMNGSFLQLAGQTTPEGHPFVLTVAVGAPGNEKVIEWAAEYAQKVSQRAPIVRADIQDEFIVHHLHHGRATCGLAGVPMEWPAEMRWSNDWTKVSCPGCLRIGHKAE